MRPDLEVAATLVPDGSRVLDLGCGDGELLTRLLDRGCQGTGVDRDHDSVLAAISRGIDVIELDLDSQLDEFDDESYDVVVVSQTLQTLRRPDLVLSNVCRIGTHAVVSMPNFGLLKHRVDLMVRGRMPTSRSIPYTWYETPNIHHATLFDLQDLLRSAGLATVQRVLLDHAGRRCRRWRARRPNVFAAGAVYLLRPLHDPDQR